MTKQFKEILDSHLNCVLPGSMDFTVFCHKGNATHCYENDLMALGLLFFISTSYDFSIQHCRKHQYRHSECLSIMTETQTLPPNFTENVPGGLNNVHR